MLLAQSVVAAVDQNAVHPGGERRLPFEPTHASIDLEERVLHSVFGIGAVAQQVKRKAFHPARVQAVQTLVCVDVPPLAALNELRVGRIFRQTTRERKRQSNLPAHIYATAEDLFSFSAPSSLAFRALDVANFRNVGAHSFSPQNGDAGIYHRNGNREILPWTLRISRFPAAGHAQYRVFGGGC